MAWRRPPVEHCPIVKKTQGIVLMEHWVIAELVGAAGETYEWTALFLGGVDERNLVIRVDNLFIPLTQIRGRGHVEIPDDWKVPDHIAPSVVGIVHLHPGLHFNNQVAFSSIDTGQGGLNERWPMSMVIGRSANEKDLQAYVTGISHQIFGRCVLPCGALGTIPYALHPAIEGEPDPEWPWPQRVIEPSIKKEGVDIQPEPVVAVEHPDLADCSRYEEGGKSTRYKLQRIASCGLVETVEWLRPKVFGATGEEILDRLPAVYPQVVHQVSKGKHKKHGRDRSYNSHDRFDGDSRLLPGWSESDY